MKTIGYMYAEDRELKMLRPMFFSEPQNAPEGFSEVQLVRRDEAEREIELLRNVMRKAIAALEDEHGYKAHTMMFDALYGVTTQTHNA